MNVRVRTCVLYRPPVRPPALSPTRKEKIHVRNTHKKNTNKHLIFLPQIIKCARASWTENVRIMAWVCLMSKHRKLTGWFILQCIKKGSTLRVSPKNQKPSPRIVYRYGKQDKQIRSFLDYRNLIKRIIRGLETGKEQT